VLQWPVGRFKYEEENTVYYEEWFRDENPGEYRGSGHFIVVQTEDTLFSTRMRLKRVGDKTLMYYRVQGQNDQEAEFTLTKEEEHHYVFENPYGGFPAIMHYTICGDTLITVQERGFDEGQQEKRWEYTVRRIPEPNE